MRHMSQEELAYRSGLSPSYISMLEQSNVIRSRSPKLTIIRDIAIALEVCPNDLIHFSCFNCPLFSKCNKKHYLHEEEEDFFDDNLIYYL